MPDAIALAAVAGEQPQLVNKNMLGWGPAVQLSVEQRTSMESAGIFVAAEAVWPTVPYVLKGGYPVNALLLEYTSNYLNSSKSASTNYAHSVIPKGSQAQILVKQCPAVIMKL